MILHYFYLLVVVDMSCQYNSFVKKKENNHDVFCLLEYTRARICNRHATIIFFQYLLNFLSVFFISSPIFLSSSSVIDASIYLRHFSSDRSHMYNSETKTWNEPPPSYDCILQQHENQHSNDSGSSNDDGNNNATYNSTTTTTTTTFKQYMTISNDDVDYQQQNGENKDNDGSNNKNESDDNNHKPIFGRVYSISRLVKRFGCSENNNNNGT